MTTTGLPHATFVKKSLKFGSFVVKNEKPTQTFKQAHRGIDNLEKAAKENVFVKHVSEE